MFLSLQSSDDTLSDLEILIFELFIKSFIIPPKREDPPLDVILPLILPAISRCNLYCITDINI